MPLHHILLYAELLSNIKQVSVGCSLPTAASTSTQATISADGRALSVAHNGSRETIQLPARVIPLPRLPIAKSGGTRLSWRLRLAAPAPGRLLPAPDDSAPPWSAIDLEPGSAVVCRACKSNVVNAGTLKVWKDLPSENWAEMMEFWHCHKPHNHHNGSNGDDEHLANRGYGASSRIMAQPGIGFVDLTSFLLAESDIRASSISISSASDEKTKATATVHCASCKSQLGVRNEQALSTSLFKWQVFVQQQAHNNSEIPPNIAQCISAMLLAMMARSGCSKSILVPIKSVSSDTYRSINSEDLLNIWIFNANITYSSTAAPTSPTTAVKVFYRTVSRVEADKMLESITSDVQDISLPCEAISTIAGLLDESNAFIPESDRKFQGWTVGLLEKWDSNDRRLSV